MKSALITGANKGIGFETARKMLREGFFVYLGSRNLENGIEAANKLKAEGFANVLAIKIDVSNQKSVDDAKEQIAANTESLDVLINNAGLNGGMMQNVLATTADDFKEVFDVNVYGVVRVTKAFMDLLQKSQAARIVNLSSVLASLSLAADDSSDIYERKYVLYNTSKAFVNMYTIHLAYELRNTLIKVNAVCPGFTKTDFNYQQGTGTTEDAADFVAGYAMLDEFGPSGKFFSRDVLTVDNQVLY